MKSAVTFNERRRRAFPEREYLHPAFGEMYPGVLVKEPLGHPFHMASCRDNPAAQNDLFDVDMNPDAPRMSATEYYATRTRAMTFWCSTCAVSAECSNLAATRSLTGPYGGAYYVKGAPVA